MTKHTVFCELSPAKLPRHLESLHKSETGVLQLACANGEERQKLLTKLLISGAPSTSVLKSSKRQLAVVYKVEDINKKEPGNYVLCQYCLDCFPAQNSENT